MTNPPPEPPSSRLGFDELLGVVVAFAVIGTILIGTLRQKDKGFLGGLLPALTTTQATPDSTASPTPASPLPTQTPQETLLPEPEVSVPVTPASPITPETPEQRSRVTAFVPVPAPAASPTPVETVPSPPAPSVQFPDVPQVFWARPYIEALATQGILTGFEDGTFRPTKPVTRAEFAAQLQKAFDQKVITDAPTYKDVPNKFWASSAIQETTRSGFLRGYPGSLFRPNQQIPKVQALVALSKGLGLASTSSPAEALKIYKDAAQIPKYATNIVAVATESGLVVNYPNRQILNPNKPLSRAEAAALTYQAMVKAGKAPAITSEYVAQP